MTWSALPVSIPSGASRVATALREPSAVASKGYVMKA